MRVGRTVEGGRWVSNGRRKSGEQWKDGMTGIVWGVEVRGGQRSEKQRSGGK